MPLICSGVIVCDGQNLGEWRTEAFGVAVWLKNWKWRRWWNLVGDELVVDVVEDVYVDHLVVRRSSWGWELMSNGWRVSWNVVAGRVSWLEQWSNSVDSVAKFRWRYVVRGWRLLFVHEGSETSSCVLVDDVIVVVGRQVLWIASTSFLVVGKYLLLEDSVVSICDKSIRFGFCRSWFKRIGVFHMSYEVTEFLGDGIVRWRSGVNRPWWMR